MLAPHQPLQGGPTHLSNDVRLKPNLPQGGVMMENAKSLIVQRMHQWGNALFER
jgi:hypothetical protein